MMARTVSPERYLERRLTIIDAALTRFAAAGYDRTTTAAICRQAKISSGTFFHYFPTKLSVLLAILDYGVIETKQWFEAQLGRTDSTRVVIDYVEHAAAEFTDSRLPGFVRAVGALMGEPEVAAALARDDHVIRAGLHPWMIAAMHTGEVRADVTALRLTEWVLALIDGYVGRVATAPEFDAMAEKTMLVDTAWRLIRV